MNVHRGQGWTLIEGDCLETMKRLRENSIDSVVTDPPYELGFMGKSWDGTGIAFRPETWAAVLRVLKPGGYLLAFGGSRTFHRIAVAIEDAGFEIRDTLSWMYGTGFPKSLNLGDGRGTALKPAWEPVIMARKPLSGTVAANVRQWETGALNIDGCRIGETGATAKEHKAHHSHHSLNAYGDGLNGGNKIALNAGRWPANVLLDEEAAAALDAQSGFSKSPGKTGRGAGGQHGRYSKIGAQGTVACPSDEVGASRFFYVAKASRSERDTGCEALPARSAGEATDREDDTAGLSSPRAGAGRTGGARNIHPTVKPVELMRWLVRLVTPPGGYVFDPFSGSGTTGVATLQEGFAFGGCEREPEYATIAVHRLTHAAQGGKGEKKPATSSPERVANAAVGAAWMAIQRVAEQSPEIRPPRHGDSDDLGRWCDERAAAGYPKHPQEKP